MSLATFLDSISHQSKPVKVVVGVAIVQHDKVLFLQRSAAEPYFPNIWELPSGKVGDEDATLLDAAARECLEETELAVIEFLAEAKSFEYMVEGRGLTLQLNFVVKAVREVTINQEEHQHYKWCNDEQVGQIGVSESTRQVLSGVFSWQKERKSWYKEYLCFPAK